MGGDTLGFAGDVIGAGTGLATSLIGANQAATGVERAQRITSTQAERAREDLASAFDPSRRFLMAGSQGAINQLAGSRDISAGLMQDFLAGAGGAARVGASTAEGRIREFGGEGISALQRGFGTARSDLGAGGARATGSIQQAMDRGIGFLDPYTQAGGSALQREAAFSGALGPEAQAQAYAGFAESPGQKYLREQQEQALLRNQAAIGGLGGGQVRTALQEQAFGIAAQNEQQYLDNLRNLAMRGQQAAGTQGGFAMQGGTAQANIQAQIAQAQAQMAAGQAQAEQQALASMGAQTGQIQSNLGTQIAGLTERAGQQAVGVEQQTAANIANLMSGTGTAMSGLTERLGANLANVSTGLGTAQSNLAQNLAAAQAAGTIGAGGAIGEGISGITERLSPQKTWNYRTGRWE